MKIPGSIRELYEDVREKYIPLKTDVDTLLRSHKRDSWHYESRLKTRESFTLKLESGKWKCRRDLDDILGVLLVVENHSVLSAAETLIKEYFDVVRRQPPDRKRATISAVSFPFDDVRLCVQWPLNSPVPKPQYRDLLFEVQLRTFLQHAWNVATHDVVYKSDVVGWPRERVAAQMRATLEHVELTLNEIDGLAKSRILFRYDDETRRIQSVIRLLHKHWDRTRLPVDVKRLATNVSRLLSFMKVSLRRLDGILSEERQLGRGALTENLSPFGTILQSLVYHDPNAVRRLLSDQNRGFTICIPAEVELSGELDQSGFFEVFQPDVL